MTHEFDFRVTKPFPVDPRAVKEVLDDWQNRGWEVFEVTSFHDSWCWIFRREGRK